MSSRIKCLIICLLLCFLTSSMVQARWLIINTLPAEAEVRVSDQDAGTTPVRLEGDTDERATITIRSEGLNDYIFEYVFSDNRVMFIDLEQGVELDEVTYWEKKTQGNILQIADIVPPPAPDGDTDSGMVEMETVADSGTAVDGGEETVPVAEIATGPRLKDVPGLPSWPETLEGATDKGVVVLDLEILRDGTVGEILPQTELKTTNLEPYLREWIQNWMFDAATTGNESLDSRMSVRLVYNLESGSFELPDQELVRTAELPQPQIIAETGGDAEETGTAAGPGTSSAGDVIYYTADQVDKTARIFSPPSPGNIPLHVINMNLQGEATFKVYINPAGNVTHVDVLKSTGNDSLDEYVVPMIEKSFWEPAKKEGESVGFVRNVTLDFYTTACKFDFTDLYQ